MTRPTAPKKTVPMCCVSVGSLDLLMPTDKGMKLVELLQSSFECERGYANRGYVYRLADAAPIVQFATVQPKQIQQPDSPLRLGHSILDTP